jgi:hypothetical protein
MTRCPRIACRRPGALEGRCLQRPRSRKLLPSKDLEIVSYFSFVTFVAFV